MTQKKMLGCREGCGGQEGREIKGRVLLDNDRLGRLSRVNGDGSWRGTIYEAWQVW